MQKYLPSIQFWECTLVTRNPLEVIQLINGAYTICMEMFGNG